MGIFSFLSPVSGILALFLCIAPSAHAQCVTGRGATNWNEQGLDGGTTAIARHCASEKPQCYHGGQSSDLLAWCAPGARVAINSRWGVHKSFAFRGEQEVADNDPRVDRLGHTAAQAIAKADSVLWSCIRRYPALAASEKMRRAMSSHDLTWFSGAELGRFGIPMCGGRNG